MKKQLYVLVAACLGLQSCEKTSLEMQESGTSKILLQESSWKQLPDIITNFERAGGERLTQGFAFSIGSKGYVGSGGYENQSLRVYDINSNTWTVLSPQLRPTAKPVAFTIGTMGYVGTGSRERGGDIFGSNELYQYDPVKDDYTLKTPLPITLRGGVGFSINGKAYIGIGITDVYRETETHSLENIYTPSNHFYEYSPGSDCWVRKADFPGEFRRDAAGFSIGDKGYVGTGFVEIGLQVEDKKSLKDFWEYDPAKDTWTKKADVPGPARHNAVGFGLANKGYVGTGETFRVSGPEILHKDFWEYDPSSNSWKQKEDFAGGGRNNLMYFTSSTKAYMGGGGYIFSFNKDFWEFDPSK